MLIFERPIDDFKTERKGVLPPLPMVMRMVPILFYLAILFAVIVSASALWSKKIAKENLESKERDLAATETKIEEIKAQRTDFDSRLQGLAELEEWVKTAIPVQPLIVTIMRSMDLQSSVGDIKIDRDAKSASLLNISLHLNADDRQLEKMVDAIRELNFRETSPQQGMKDGVIDYSAALVWVNPAEATSSSPEAEANEPPEHAVPQEGQQ